jgi:PLP dependent protein
MSSPDGHRRLPTEGLLSRLKIIQSKIQQAAERSGRSGGDITLVAVTKTVAPEIIVEALGLGICHIGENKVQETDAKRPTILEAPLSQGVCHHFIGHLQTNKVRRAVALFDVIQSVDSSRLAETINRVAGEAGKKQRCLVEVKISAEATKTGMAVGQAQAFVKSFSRYENLKLEGLMTIAPLEATEKELRGGFRLMKNLFDASRPLFGEKPMLSMGMTDDFESAIEEGSTMVRLGRALFGERNV